MGDPIKVEMTLADMRVEEPDKAVFDSVELVNALVVAPANAWQLIATSFGLMVDPDNIRVREDGHIVITNQELADKVKEILNSGAGASTNVGACGNAYRCLV